VVKFTLVLKAYSKTRLKAYIKITTKNLALS
jgi:hypothetical protein